MQPHDAAAGPRGAPGPRWREAALLAFVAWHLLSSAARLAAGTPPGDLLRDHLTRPYEEWIRNNQSWEMFSPNPPRTARWVEIHRQDPAGHPLPVWLPLSGEVVPSGVIWGYDRLHKVERSLTGRSKAPFRQALLERACRVPHDGAEVGLVGLVVVTRHLQAAWAPEREERLETERFEVLSCSGREP